MDAKRRIMMFSVGVCLCVALAICGVIKFIKPLPSLHRQFVALTMISNKNNPSLPQSKILYRPQAEFISSNEVSVAVCVDYVICIQNDSNWPYVVASPYSLTGYDSLEFDLMLDDGGVATIKRCRPQYLSDKGDWIVISPRTRWEHAISLDDRLWDFPSESVTNKVFKIRPRFAYGAFMIDGKYYRTQEEAEKRRKIKRDWDDREGELIGDWIDYCQRDTEMKYRR